MTYPSTVCRSPPQLAFAQLQPLRPASSQNSFCPKLDTVRPFPRRAHAARSQRSRFYPRCTASASHPEVPPERPENENASDGSGENDTDAPESIFPTEASFSSEVLRRRISELSTGGDDDDDDGTIQSANVDQVLDLFSIDDDDVSPEQAEKLIADFESLSSVYVIVFTSANDGVEGVYSLSVAEENIVLAFQKREDAHRYAVCLQAQKFPEPQISEMGTADLCNFCAESGFRLGFVPKDMHITPPDESAIDDLDKWRGTAEPGSQGTSMSDDDIDAMRKHFDSLFGQ